jgi:hypothetical protein
MSSRLSAERNRECQKNRALIDNKRSLAVLREKMNAPPQRGMDDNEPNE